MIPKDLLILINRYNEPGIFITANIKIVYWFNGKQWEHWEIKPKRFTFKNCNPFHCLCIEEIQNVFTYIFPFELLFRI